jgi:hypothetical protein
MKPIRIGISGPSGTGKTTLAQYISKNYDIPFITTSTKPLWDKHGITSHLELIQKTVTEPSWGMDFQKELLEWRSAKLEGVHSFVTDRTPIDNLVYFLLQCSSNQSDENIRKYILDCGRSLYVYTGFIALPFNNSTILENDGKRVPSRYYQEFVNHNFDLALGFLREYLTKSKTISLHEWDFETRRLKVDYYIKSQILEQDGE